MPKIELNIDEKFFEAVLGSILEIDITKMTTKQIINILQNLSLDEMDKINNKDKGQYLLPL